MQKILLISLLLLSKLAFNLIKIILNDNYRNQIGLHYIPKTTASNHSRLVVSSFAGRYRVVGKGDVLISEVLFNPKSGGVDFVEIYNHSGHDIDLKEVQLGNLNAAGLAASIKNISSVRHMIAPGSYWVISTSSENIRQSYEVKYPNQLIQLNSLPAYGNEKGNVVLLSGGQIIDQLNYTSKIHHPLLRDEDGISIERVSFDVDANTEGNFKSAAANIGFATPTYKNSQMLVSNENSVKLSSKTFSPDGDGYEDLLLVNYQLDNHAKLANINIYSDQGKLVRKLCQNQTIATEGRFIWDGLNERGELSAVGIYVVVFECFDLSGQVKKFKNTCVLAMKLND